MSIQDDVEKLMRDDLESKGRKEKKKKKKRLLFLLIILLLLAALLAILQWLGLGLGGGKGEGGDGNGNESVNPSSSSAAADESSEEDPEYFDVMVSGSKYIVDNNLIDLDTISSRVKGLKDNYIIRISNDNATANAMDDLKARLDAEGRKFITTELSDESSAVESEKESSKV